MKHRRVLDALDRDLVCTKVEKHPHTLEDVRPCLYNRITSQIAPAEVNVADSIEIEENMERDTLPVYLMGFTILSVGPCIKTMFLLKKQLKGRSTCQAMSGQL